MSKITTSCFLLLSVLFLTAFGINSKPPAGVAGEVYSASVSTDGNYALTIDKSQHVVLWDITNKSYKVIDSLANPYSAYFIPNKNVFLYQKINKEVIVEDINGKQIKKFDPGFLSYGNAISSDLNTYVGEDSTGQIFMMQNGKNIPLMIQSCKRENNVWASPPNHGLYFCGYAPIGGGIYPANVMFTQDNKYIIVSDSQFNMVYPTNDIYSWGQYLSEHNYASTISPDNDNIFIGDDAGNFGIYNIPNKIPQTVQNLFMKQGYKPVFLLSNYDNIVLSGSALDSIIAFSRVVSIKFINNTNYLVFYQTDYQFDYAALYSSKNNHLVKYLKLAGYTDAIQPYSALDAIDSVANKPNYSRRLAIATSPNANILVMGQNNGNGIMVYKYDPKVQSLRLIWSPQISNSYRPNSDAPIFQPLNQTFLIYDPNNSGDLFKIGAYFYLGSKGGIDYPQTYQQAIYWYLKAAALGNTDAENEIGNMYYKGEGVKQNYMIANQWYMKAAEAGNAIAQFNLAVNYLAGRDFAQSCSQGLYWLNKSVNQGYADAIKQLEILKENNICYSESGS